MSKRNVGKWVLLSICILFNAFILVESALPASLSTLQSDFFANIFGDLYTPPAKEEIRSIDFVGDVENKQIVRGTTSTFDLTYEPATASMEQVDIVGDGIGSSYNVIQDGQRLYVEAYEIGTYQLNVSLKNRPQVSTSVSFNIINRPAPTEYSLSIQNSTIKVGMSAQIDVKLSESGTLKDEISLSRQYDKKAIRYQSSDDTIATIDEYGVIHALSPGTVEIHSSPANKTLTVNVIESDSPSVMPTGLELIGPDSVHIYDADYIGDDLIEKAQLSVQFLGNTPSDAGVTYTVNDDLLARVEDDGTIYGYKKTGTVRVYAYSNMDRAIFDYIDINVENVIPTDMNIVGIEDDGSLSIGATKTIRAEFAPINTTNTAIIVTSSDDSIIKVTNNDRSAIIEGIKAGKATLTISSASNENLVKTFTINVAKLAPSEDSNYDDFISFIRKAIGHFTLFAIDGVLIFFSIYLFVKDNEKMKLWIISLISIGASVLVAACSELFQFIPKDRGPSIVDVGIDSLGALIGILIVLIIMSIIKVVKKRRTAQKKK